MGFDVGVNPIQARFEIGDFYTGIFAVDLAGDDQVWVGPRLFDTATPEEAAAIADAEAPAQ